LFIEYATSAGHYKNIYTEMRKKDIKHYGKKAYKQTQKADSI